MIPVTGRAQKWTEALETHVDHAIDGISNSIFDFAVTEAISQTQNARNMLDK
jgi:hypothetical protein